LISRILGNPTAWFHYETCDRVLKNGVQSRKSGANPFRQDVLIRDSLIRDIIDAWVSQWKSDAEQSLQKAVRNYERLKI